ncbi:hypothetical protein ACOMHN_056948 [Nucella lapillus]
MQHDCNWRTVKEWQDLNVPITTPSDQACKMFDAALTQYVQWKEEPSVGGIEGAVEKMLAADPDFAPTCDTSFGKSVAVMGHVIKNGLDLIGTGRSVRLDAAFQADIDAMATMADRQTTSPLVSLNTSKPSSFSLKGQCFVLG